jgi:demethylmenaquinone methyltransferase/2-methoxy-6-polyprenyl-1,4-benzoquinol methylase
MEKKGEPKEVRAMFDRAARSYDFLNHLFSFRIDASWRRRLVARSGALPGARVLDVCTGTGDVALRFARQAAAGRVIGVDFSQEMLARGRSKAERAGLSGSVQFRKADAQDLPFPDGSFDVVCNSLGLRTLADRARAIAEMARVASAGASVLVLEFLPPPPTLFGRLYSWHLGTLMPFLGSLLSGYRRSYTYLTETVAEFPSPEVVVEMMERAGLAEIGFERLTGGIVCLFRAVKPPRLAGPARRAKGAKPPSRRKGKRV